jgi:uncharacterized protein (TIGR02996 family)
MSDHDALFAAILAQPEEDTPRLAYADWLDEFGGDSGRARAEFIRTQIELSRGGHTDRRRKSLADRCAELENAHAKEWLAPLPAAPIGQPDAKFAFRRGFVEFVSARWWLLERFPAVAATCPLLRADINFAWVTRAEKSPVMAGCPDLARLRRLECRRFPRDFAEAVLASPHLTGLHTLCLQWGWLEDGVELVSRSPVARNLRHLWVWGAGPGEIRRRRGFGKIVEAEWPALTQVRLDNLSPGEAGTLSLVREGAKRGWQAVHVHDRTLTQAGVVEAMEEALAGKLQSLSLTRDCDLKEPPEPVPDGVRNLALRSLPADGDLLARWVAANVPPGRFNRLSLRDCGLTDATARALAAWRGLAHVTELDLRANRITDDGAEALAASPHLNEVKLLLVADNPLAKRGKEALKKRFARRVRVAE